MREMQKSKQKKGVISDEGSEGSPWTGPCWRVESGEEPQDAP